MSSPTTDYFALMGMLNWQIPVFADEGDIRVPEGALETFSAVHDAILARGTRVVSFDVFDTLVVRDICPAEAIPGKTAHFLHVLLAAQGVDLEPEEIRCVRDQETDRLRSESQALGLDGEVSAADSIRAWLSALQAKLNLQLTEALADRLIDYELGQEIDHARAAPGALEWLPRIAEAARVVAVSDTAWSARQVQTILAQCGLARHIQSIFVSSEEGVNKRSGRLFGRVLEKVNCLPGEMLHFGDHAGSDCQIPRSLGIDAYQLIQPEVLRAYRVLENRLFLARQFGYAAPPQDVDVSPSAASPHSVAYGLGKNVFALPFFLFARHLLEADNRYRFARLFFLSRDGYLAWRVFQQIADGVGLFRDNHAGERAAYVHLSRVSTEIPDLKDGLAELVAWHDRWINGRSLSDAFDLLGLDGDKYRAFVGSQAPSVERGHGISFIQLLNSSPDFRRTLMVDLADKRNLLEAYLESIGFFCGPDASVMVADIGWKGTVVRNIEKLFGHRPDYPRVHVFMWGVSRDYSDIGFDLHPGYFSDSSRALPLEALVLRCHEAFEMVAAETTAGCIGYVQRDGAVAPHFALDAEGGDQQERCDIQQGVLDSIPAWLSWYNRYLIADELRVTALARMLQPILRPDDAYHALLMGLHLDLDLGSRRQVRLGSLLSDHDIDLSVCSSSADLPLQLGSAGGRSPAYAYERLLAVITEVTLPGKPLILWGAGVIGRLMLPHLRSRVAVILDVNPSLQGTEIDGIPVIAPEAAMERNLVGHIVVFTPLNRRPQIDLSATGAEIVLVDDRLR